MARLVFLAVLLSFGPVVANSLARFAYALVVPAMRDDLALTWSQAGWLNTISAIGYLGGAILARLLVVRVGNRRLFQAGMALTALAILATGLSRDLDVIAAMRLLAGVTSAAVFVCGGALAANLAPQRPAAAMTLLSVFFSGPGVGMIASGAVIPSLIEIRGNAAWPLVWIGMGVVAVAMSVAAGWAASRIEEPGAAPGSVAWDARRFLPEILGYLMFAVGYIGYMTFVVAWMRDNGAGVASVTTAWCVLGLATMVAPAGWRGPLDRWRDGRPMAAGLALLAAGAAIPLVSAQFGWILASAALFGSGMVAVPAAVTALVRHGLPKPAWGSAMAGFTIVFAAGQVFGPIATGWLADVFGSLRPGLAASVALLLAGSLICLFQRDVARPS